MFLMGAAITVVWDSIVALTTGIRVIIGIDMEDQPIGTTAPDVPTVHEAAPPTGMTGREVQPVGAEARRRGIMARVTSADIVEARRTGAVVPEVQRDGAAAPRLGVADRVRFMGPVVAPVRGGVELGAWTSEKAGFACKL
jgi:hypothetical protein